LEISSTSFLRVSTVNALKDNQNTEQQSLALSTTFLMRLQVLLLLCSLSSAQKVRCYF